MANPQEPAWYVVYTMGYEDKIKQQILKRAENMEAMDRILEVFVPKKSVTKIKGGKKVEQDIAQYQRYLFVNMQWDDITYRCVRNTPGVLNIIEKPLSQTEVAKLFGRKKRIMAPMSAAQGDESAADSISQAPVMMEYRIDFEAGDEVKILGGAFDGFTGKADTIDMEHGRVTVMINIFGQMTPVDLTLDQVQAIQ